MKFRVPLEYDDAFLDVARTIAKGEPPQWLLICLTHFSASIAVTLTTDDHHQSENISERMHKAANTLLRWLPIFERLPWGAQCSDDVRVVLDALPRIKKALDPLIEQEHTGRKADVRREICAAVVVEAWKLLHGKAEPRSVQFQQACKDYWRACGCEEIGATDDIENWRRPAERALVTDHEWIRSTLLAVQNPT